MKALIFLLHPAFVIATLEFKSYVTLDANCAREDYRQESTYGQYDWTVIIDAERSDFNLDEKSLKDYFETYWRVRPKRVSLQGYPELKEIQYIKKFLKPIFSRVTKMTTTREFTRRDYNNDGDEPKTVNVGLYTIVHNKIFSRIARGNTSGHSIIYELNVNTKRLGSIFSWKFEAPWWSDYESDYEVRIGEPNGLDIKLDPGQTVVASLQVTKHVLQIEVEYLALLYGNIDVVFDNRLEGRLEDLRVPELNDVTVTQVVDVEFYADAKLFVVDTTNLCKLGEKDFKVNIKDP